MEKRGSTLLDRLKAAWEAFRNHDNEPDHKYHIVIGDARYMADAYSICPYSGLPEWDYDGLDGRIHCKAYGGVDLEGI